MATTITITPDKLVASKNDTWAAAQTTDPDTYIRLEIYIMPDDLKIATINAPTDAADTAIFNIKSVLQSMGKLPNILQYQLPVFNQTTPSIANNNIKKYYLKFFSVSSATGLDLSFAETTKNFIVLLAGKNFINANQNLINIIGDGAGVLRKFLTMQPAEKKVSETQQEYLYYYHNQNGIGAGNIALKVIITFSDNTTVQQTLSSIAVTDGQVAIYPVGFSQLNLASYVPAGKTAVSYSVCAVLQSAPANPVTNTFTYVLDDRCFVKRKEFLFLNSFGGIDTLFVTDTQESGIDVTFETAERFLQRNYSVQEGQYYNFYKQGTQVIKCTTDLLTYSERLYLQDFFISTNIWEIINGQFIPIILTDSNYTLHKNQMEVQNIQFTYKYAFDTTAYNNF